jgi:hypothetical protein
MNTSSFRNRSGAPRSRGVLAVLVALCAPAAPAAAGGGVPPPAAPITIDRCSVDEATAIQNPRVGLHTSYANGIVIGYTNERDATATEVRFRVKYAGKTLVFADRGAFAAHAKIDREFTKFTAVYNGSTVECGVLSATFADGTHWDAPDTVPAPSPSPSP